MISGINSNSLLAGTSGSTNGSSSSSNSSTSSTDNSTVTKNMFLQLLVAQIKNQDPLSPSDGIQFVTQLAQFQQLEQSMNLGTDVSAIKTDLDKLTTTASATGTTTGTTENNSN
jgi:flagellar basal-body rod modification protein FlgD